MDHLDDQEICPAWRERAGLCVGDDLGARFNTRLYHGQRLKRRFPIGPRAASLRPILVQYTCHYEGYLEF